MFSGVPDVAVLGVGAILQHVLLRAVDAQLRDGHKLGAPVNLPFLARPPVPGFCSVDVSCVAVCLTSL